MGSAKKRETGIGVRSGSTGWIDGCRGVTRGVTGLHRAPGREVEARDAGQEETVHSTIADGRILSLLSSLSFALLSLHPERPRPPYPRVEERIRFCRIGFRPLHLPPTLHSPTPTSPIRRTACLDSQAGFWRRTPIARSPAWQCHLSATFSHNRHELMFR